MRSPSTMFRRLVEIDEALKEDDYPVTSFDFVVDDGSFSPYCQESADMAGFTFKTGMPVTDAFFYCSKEYEAYLDVLAETGIPHPALKASCSVYE